MRSRFYIYLFPTKQAETRRAIVVLGDDVSVDKGGAAEKSVASGRCIGKLHWYICILLYI